MREILRPLAAGLRILALMTVICGVVYPMAVTAGARVVPDRADGSLIHVDGTAVGSRLLAQPFTSAQYFHPRPSAGGFDGAASTGSNLGPTNPEHLDLVADRIADYRTTNNLAADAPVPVDAVTASASGLDPHISPRNARLQAPRVAAGRDLPADVVLELVERHVQSRPLNLLGEDVVNVLELNVALDRLVSDRIER